MAETIKVGLLTLHLQLPGCDSLKAKRRRLKPLLARLQKEFHASAAEVGDNDAWQRSVIACVLVGNENSHVERRLQKIVAWLERHQPDMLLVSEQIEIIQ